jgi:hypothetical protein
MQPLVDRIAMRAFLPILAAAAIVAAPDAVSQARMESAPLVTPFSSLKAGAPLSPAWEPVKIAAGKKPTQYQLVDDQGTVVLRARADAAASGLGHDVNFDLRAAPIIEWRWKTAHLIDDADNSVAQTEDSPVRIVLQFDGDRSKLSLRDRTYFALGDRVAGRDVPYATLMYIWSNKSPVGSMIQNPHTGRVRMIVASSGPEGVGTWQDLRRNAFEDFRKTFGEEPGRLIAVGVLTDTDNTGASAESWYGDIRFLPVQ